MAEVILGKMLEPLNEDVSKEKKLNIEYVGDIETYIKENNLVDAMEGLNKIWQGTWGNEF